LGIVPLIINTSKIQKVDFKNLPFLTFSIAFKLFHETRDYFQTSSSVTVLLFMCYRCQPISLQFHYLMEEGGTIYSDICSSKPAPTRETFVTHFP